MPKENSRLSTESRDGIEKKKMKAVKSPKRLQSVMKGVSKGSTGKSPITTPSSSNGSLKKLKKVISSADKKIKVVKKMLDTDNSFSSNNSRNSSINNSIRSLMGNRRLFGKKAGRKIGDTADLPPKSVSKVTLKNSRKRPANDFKNTSTPATKPSTNSTPTASTHSTSLTASSTPPSSTNPTPSTTSTNPWTQHLQQDSLHQSYEEASLLFGHLIQPVSSAKFFRDIWQKKPLLVRRHNKSYNDGLFSLADFDKILREERLSFTQNIDVVTYEDDARQTHNPEGPARAPLVWNFYQQGCSVRLLNPQTYNHTVHAVLSLLQEFFSCVAGANVYLTPPGSQGFAPHYDDIDAFVVQLEGSKAWKVYEPASEEQRLPRFSSRNFSSGELSEPVLDVLMERGDMLYFPRGFIHQASTSEDSHSLHMTISVGQKNTWADLLTTLVPRALELAVEECVGMRESLPPDYLQYMGIVHSEENNKKRTDFKSRLCSLFNTIINHAPIDSAVDQMAKNLLATSLPPCLTSHEKKCSIEGEGRPWGVGQKVEVSELQPSTEVKVIRKGCIRLVTEDQVYIYHNLDNSPLSETPTTSPPIQVSSDEAELVEVLIKTYPDFLKVKDLPMDDEQAKLDLMQLLYDRGILLTKVPLNNH